MMQKLIVNADDFGLCSSVNKAIIDCHLAGNINSTTLMVNMPGSIEAVELAKQHPKLGIGLHFCITEGLALTGPSSITNNKGEFYDWGNLNKRILKGEVKKWDIEEELKAQFDFLKNANISATHADSHQHIHMNNMVFSVFKSFFQGSNLPIRLVDPPINFKLLLGRPKKGIKQILLKTLSNWHRKGLKNNSNDILVSIHDLVEHTNTTTKSYEKILNKLQKDSIVELMVHPYINGTDLKNIYLNEWNKKRPFFELCFDEHNILNKKNFIQNISGLLPIRYDEI